MYTAKNQWKKTHKARKILFRCHRHDSPAINSPKIFLNSLKPIFNQTTSTCALKYQKYNHDKSLNVFDLLQKKFIVIF